MAAIWSPENKIIAERRLWLAVLRAQSELGIPVPDGVVADYERCWTTSTWPRSRPANG
jgi:adenylosuccinate lyase